MRIMLNDGSIIESEDESDEGKDINKNLEETAIWYTTAHIMAQAIKRLYPDAKLATGPVGKDGFYYDIDFGQPFMAEEQLAIEYEMKQVIKENLPIKRLILSRDKAIERMKSIKEFYKVELLEKMPIEQDIILFQQGEFLDLWEGPHVTSVRQIRAFQLMSIAGAYWLGIEQNKMLTRLYGVAFSDKEKLRDYRNRMEEAGKRDHRKIGKELGLFLFDDAGPGFPIFLPKGMVLKNILVEFWRKMHEREGYVEVSTPILLNTDLWKTSGHWDLYRENMYTTEIDEQQYAVKPMNCPGGMLVYKSQPRSYREFPLRIGELGLVHRHEKSGALHGLMRVRCFTQDDAHIFMTENQVTDEIVNVIKLIDSVYQKFGFCYHAELSTRPQKSIGSEEEWEMATNALINAMERLNMKYQINEGDGAFYGPKIDFHLRDAIGRTWQCGTIQLDFQLPQRFQIEYTGEDGNKHRPIMIHRVVFGSIERFIAILIEHYEGKFPLWLAPVQVKVLLISEKAMDYAFEVFYKLKEQGIRCEIDVRDEKIGYKIREAQLDKIPYMLIVGPTEADHGLVSVRSRDSGDMGSIRLHEFIERLKEENRI